MPDGVRGQYCVSALTDTQTISCAKEQTEKTVLKSVGANLKTVGFSLRTLYYFRAHRLVLYPDKTVYMLFSNSNIVNRDVEIFIDNNNYSEISQFKSSNTLY